MKKKIVIVFAICIGFVVSLWIGALAKNLILTEIHKKEIENMEFAECVEPLPEFDWYRITSYSEEKIEIYYVNNMAGEYKIGGKMMFRKTPNGWRHTDMVESVLWSGAGSADDYFWPYWYHIFLK